MSNTIEKVKNYQGKSHYILSLKQSLQKYGGLTAKQLVTAEKVLSSVVKEINMESLPQELKNILSYKGENKFVLDIIEKIKRLREEAGVNYFVFQIRRDQFEEYAESIIRPLTR